MVSIKIIAIIAILVVVGASLIYITTREEVLLSPEEAGVAPQKVPGVAPQVTGEACKTIVNNGENKINIVFFAQLNQVQNYIDTLLSAEPFKKNAGSFNFFLIDSYTPQCEIYKDIAVLCASEELTKKAASCPNDYIIVIKDEDPKIRNSALGNTISLNSQSSLSVIQHELGHALANLADEYSPAKIPANSKNCQQSCEMFKSLTSDCFSGCSGEGYSRSIETGIMKSLKANSFGVFDESLIEEQIKKQASQSSPITGKAITGKAIAEPNVECAGQKYYLIKGDRTPGDIKILSRTIEGGCVGNNGAGPFNYSIIKQDDTIVKEGEFNADVVFTDGQAKDEQIIDGETFDYEGPFFLKIPIIENTKEIKISTPTQEISIMLGANQSITCMASP